MKKPYWLKKSFLKYRINIFLFNIFSFFIIKKKEKNKILITQLDGIGDIVVRQGLVNLIAKKYGRENIVLLVTYAAELIELSNYNFKVFEKNSHYNFLKLLKIYKKLSQYGFLKLYSLEFISEDKIDFLKKFRFKEIYGFKGGFLDKWKAENTHLTERKGEKILDILYNYAVDFIEPNVNKPDLKPKINVPKTDGDYIAVGIGSSDKKKIASPEKLAEFLNIILNNYPDTKFHILGSGKSDEIYFEELRKLVDNRNLENYVGKLALLESVSQIADSKLYIGFDSGLYNIAYSLEKDQICIVSINRNKHFFHEDNSIIFVYKELNFEKTVDSLEKIYNSDIDSISAEVFLHYFNIIINRKK